LFKLTKDSDPKNVTAGEFGHDKQSFAVPPKQVKHDESQGVQNPPV
jgi:hypothetical protein